MASTLQSFNIYIVTFAVFVICSINLVLFLGVVMLTVMVCCFLVFGVQKGDENVLNTSRQR